MKALRHLRKLADAYVFSRSLHGKPTHPIAYPAVRYYDRLRWGPLGKYISFSRRIPSWTRGAEALALAKTSALLPEGAAIVEIGSFLGASTVLLAGARRVRGSGKVHAVDPFDASGDAFSVPIYRSIRNSLPVSLRQRFEANIRGAGLQEWVQIHQGRAVEVAASWTEPIDLLFLDGDQSYDGVRSAYDYWEPFLKPGGIIAVHNSRGQSLHESHNGHIRLVQERIELSHYANITYVDSITFASKLAVANDSCNTAAYAQDKARHEG